MDIQNLNPYNFTSASFKKLRNMILKGISLTEIGEISDKQMNQIEQQLAFILQVVLSKVMIKLDISPDKVAQYLATSDLNKPIYENKNFRLTAKLKENEKGVINIIVNIVMLNTSYAINATIRNLDNTPVLTAEEIITLLPSIKEL